MNIDGGGGNYSDRRHSRDCEDHDWFDLKTWILWYNRFRLRAYLFLIEVWREFRRKPKVYVGKIAAGIGVFLIILALWLRPELLGYQWYMVPFQPDCFVVQKGFKTGGNANRVEALFYALQLAESRQFRYIAIPEDWQAWLCKLLNADSIRNMPIPLVPVDTPEGCPEVFDALSGLRSERVDVCEEWHLANFFRLPRYLDLKWKYDYWRYFLPTGRTTGKNYRRNGNARMQQLQEQHPGKLIVTVHKRFLSVWCNKDINYAQMASRPLLDRYCHLTPEMVLETLAEAGYRDVDELHIIVSSDGYMPNEDQMFRDMSWEFQGEEVSFFTQIWTWILSDVHLGHPNSTIDQLACRWRNLLPDHQKVPCLPFALAHRVEPPTLSSP